MEPTPQISVENADRPLLAGVDIGGTGIKIGLVDNRGRTLAHRVTETHESLGPDHAVSRIGQLLREMLDDEQLTLAEITALGLGCPGTMDIPRGYLLEPPNLRTWWNYPIRDRLADQVGLPVAFANDGAAAAAGEFWIGSGRKFGSIVMLTLGTGVGGGIIVDGTSIDGENSHGSECGHIIIDSSDDARVCSCGQRGHLEAYASATAVIKRTQESIEQGAGSCLSECAEELTGLSIARAAESGDGLARRIIEQTADYLAVGITTLVHTIDPGAVILGGAMNFGGDGSPLGRSFLERIQAGFRRLAFPTPAKNTVISFASLGGDAGYIGAAGIARQRFAVQS